MHPLFLGLDLSLSIWRVRALLYGCSGISPLMNSSFPILASPSRSILRMIAIMSDSFAKYPCFLKKFFKFLESIYP